MSGLSRYRNPSFLLVAFLVLGGCTPSGTTPSGPSATPRTTDALTEAPSGQPREESLDELYAAAQQEGKVVLYSVLPPANSEVIFPAFREAYPGIEIEQVDLTSDDLVTRIIAEARGGAVIADVAHFNIVDLYNLDTQQLLEHWTPLEAEEYADELHGDYWIGLETQIWLGAWNTTLVAEGDAPSSFEDFTDARWNGQLIGEPRDWQMIPAIADGKYGGDVDAAIDLFTRIAANEPTFHRGHSDLAELLVAGQAGACFTCYSHHFPPRIESGAPLDYFLTEGVGVPAAMSVVANAPHPNAAKLFVRWSASVEGQRAFAEGERIPTHPDVDPIAPVRPDTVYSFRPEHITATADDGRTFEEVWQAIFRLR